MKVFDMESPTSKLTFGNGRQKILYYVVLAIVTVLAIGFIIATIILGVKYSNREMDNSSPSSRNRTNSTDSGQICNTEECVRAAGDILKSLDKTENPCVDFYKFACGNWVKNNPIPESVALWDGFNILPMQLYRRIRGILESKIIENEPAPLIDAKVFYQSCMNQNVTDQIALKDLIEITLKVDYISINVGLKLGELRRRIGAQFIFGLDVELDQKNTSNHVIYLDRPSLGLDRTAYIDPNNPDLMPYIVLIEAAWRLVYPEDVTTDLAMLAKNILKFEAKLAQIIDDNNTMPYNLLTLSELKRLTDHGITMNWEVYITEVFRDVVQNHNVDLGNLPNLTVVVMDVKYFKELGSLLSVSIAEDPAILVNYLRWRIMLMYMYEVSSPLQDVYFEYQRKTRGFLVPPPRWEICADRANSAFGLAISYHYVQEVFHPNFGSMMTDMVENIRSSVLDIIDKVNWIKNDQIRSRAKEKVQKMRTFIGFPDWLLKNRTALDSYYHWLEFNRSATYFNNVLHISKWKSMEDLKDVTRPQDKEKWLVQPTFVGAFYSPTHNSITVPAGYLQPPFYFTGRPIQAINYGAIGTILGHEITHGLDLVIADSIAQEREPENNENGTKLEWWLNIGTFIEHSNRAECFVKQYKKYIASEATNLTINGNTTLGENIADNAGFDQSYKAYQSYIKKHGPEPRLPGLDYSPQQLFFIAFSQTFCGSYTPHGLESQILNDVHTPNHFRVRGVLENYNEFADAWNCMRPDPNNTCRIW